MILFMTLLILKTQVYAATNYVVDNPGYYSPNSIGDEAELGKRAGVILGIINVVGVVISVITLMVMGIKYMIGSVEEKAEYKKGMGMYILGAFLVFSITTIPNILYKFASNF